MKPIVIANWKLNPQSQREVKDLFNALKEGLEGMKGVETVICPPFVYLAELQAINKGLLLGGQDCFWEEGGAFTGEISATQLRDLGCEYVIIGHSERRHYFGETGAVINKKIKAALRTGLKVIFCVGETQAEHDQGEVQKIVAQQLQQGLEGVAENQLKNILVAYEPVWAIGSGNACSSQEAQEIGQFLKEIIQKLYSQEVAVLYGGSVTSENAKDYIAQGKINGLLVGGASLVADEFVKIIKSIA